MVNKFLDLLDFFFSFYKCYKEKVVCNIYFPLTGGEHFDMGLMFVKCLWYVGSHFAVSVCVSSFRIATMQDRFMKVQVYLFLRYSLMLLCMFVNRGMWKDSTKKPGQEKLKVSVLAFCHDYQISTWHSYLERKRFILTHDFGSPQHKVKWGSLMWLSLVAGGWPWWSECGGRVPGWAGKKSMVGHS